jgi:hypothetical protein
MKKTILSVLLIGLTLNFAQARSEKIERLLGFQYGPKGMTFQVRSGGCTDKSDFNLVLSNTHPQSVHLYRTNPRMCRASMPFGTKIHYTFKEIGLSQGEWFEIENPLNDFMAP